MRKRSLGIAGSTCLIALMRKTQLLLLFLVFALIVSGCSIEVEGPTAITSTPTFETIPTKLPPTESPTPTDRAATTQIPVTWDKLNLTGRLVYINGDFAGDAFRLQIQSLNLVTGEVTTIFEAPKYSWIYHLTVSPGAKHLIMSYSPPPLKNEPVDQDLYIVPLDGSQPPQLLFTLPTREDNYIEAEWSPDGEYIYFTHINSKTPLEPAQASPLYEIYRMKYPDGQRERVAEKAYEPRLSPDGSQVVYVGVDPFTPQNKLYIADADGGNAQEVVLKSPQEGLQVPEIINAPIFSADGNTILFSTPTLDLITPTPFQSYQPNRLDPLMDVSPTRARSEFPSDWWSVPVTGGEITQLTNIRVSGLFASRSPDHRYIASYSLHGIFVMEPDGAKLTILVPNPQAIPSTVSWIP